MILCRVFQLYAGARRHGVHLPFNNAREDGERERSWVLDGRVGASCWEVMLGVTVRIFPLSFLFFLGPASEFFFLILCNNNQQWRT